MPSLSRRSSKQWRMPILLLVARMSELTPWTMVTTSSLKHLRKFPFVARWRPSVRRSGTSLVCPQRLTTHGIGCLSGPSERRHLPRQICLKRLSDIRCMQLCCVLRMTSNVIAWLQERSSRFLSSKLNLSMLRLARNTRLLSTFSTKLGTNGVNHAL